MATRGILLINSSLVATAGSSVSPAMTWNGGRTVFTLNGTGFASGLFLQLQGGNGAWMNINPATISQDTAQNFDLPAGQYRIASGVGSSVGINANLVSIPNY